MKRLILTIYLIVIATGFYFIGSMWADEKTPVVDKHLPIDMPIVEKKPLVQMAILLDTSGSMSGLINQARAELWAIVNEFILAKRDGQAPELQVALYEYGKSLLSSESGYIRQIVPFTTDLDKVSEELFALKTNGGDEYCGWVIKEATQSLKWSDNADDLKVIFIAGNEPFTQGPVDYRKVCKEAISKGIIVNTIHCGSDGEGINGKWKDGAVLADGKYLNINHNRQIVHIKAPQDREITELGARLNDTYIAFGQVGAASRDRQIAQDKSALTASAEAAIQRAVAKSSMNYRNETWDMIDALQAKKVKLEDIEAKDLPKEMQKMTLEEKKAYVKTQTERRAEIQQKIQQLNEQRKKYVAEQTKKQQKQSNTLGSAIVSVVREQASKKHFTFELAPKVSEQTDDSAAQ